MVNAVVSMADGPSELLRIRMGQRMRQRFFVGQAERGRMLGLGGRAVHG